MYLDQKVHGYKVQKFALIDRRTFFVWALNAVAQSILCFALLISQAQRLVVHVFKH
jgi:hypothetical protein